MRIGIDLGGTKIEALAIDNQGIELVRYRMDTPRDSYGATISAIASLVKKIEDHTSRRGTIGIGIPGSISRASGFIKNSNCVWLNGHPLHQDLTDALDREVRLANDANCFAVSEATDGAAAGQHVVFGVILGTGCGGGVAINGRAYGGANSVAGEWGHMPLPWPKTHESPGPGCYCGKTGCMEVWISGTGISLDFRAVTGKARTSREIVAGFEAGELEATAAMDRFLDRLARGLAQIINILDPDAFVIGGGVSKVDHLYGELLKRIPAYVFGEEASTPILPAMHGDSSGIRGAAWLWPNEPY
jgi:fructokinase